MCSSPAEPARRAGWSAKSLRRAALSDALRPGIHVHRISFGSTGTMRPRIDLRLTASMRYIWSAPTDRVEQLPAMRPFLELALERDIGPIILLSASALSEGEAMMGEVHAWLRAHADRWGALRPSWFMQNFITQHFPSIIDEGRIYSRGGGWTGAVYRRRRHRRQWRQKR